MVNVRLNRLVLLVDALELSARHDLMLLMDPTETVSLSESSSGFLLDMCCVGCTHTIVVYNWKAKKKILQKRVRSVQLGSSLAGEGGGE